MEKLNEEQKDSVQQESSDVIQTYPDIPEELKKHYTQVVMNNLGMRIEVEKDFRWVRQKLILMREVSHTERISLINEMVEYLDKAIPELEKIRIAFEEQINKARETGDSKSSG